MGVFTVSVHVMISTGPVLNIRMDLVILIFCNSYFTFVYFKNTALTSTSLFHLVLFNTSIVTSVHVFLAVFSTITPGVLLRSSILIH